MKSLFKELSKRFKEKSLKFKLLSSLVLVLYLFVICISTLSIDVFKKEDYYLLTPGEANLVGRVIDVDSIHSPGNVYTLSVFEFKKVSVLQYWLSKNNHSNYIGVNYQSHLTKEEELIQGTIMKNTSITNAIIVAYSEASKVNPNVSISYKYVGGIVHTVSEKADGSIKQKDIITKVNGVAITEENINQLFSDARVNDSLILTVKRDNKFIDVTTKYYIDDDGEKYMGINFYSYYEIIEATPSYKVYESSTTGPSGGLMQTIAIYNSLIAEDITKGKKIMGTGTIEINGSVGVIGGVEQKMIAANIYKADYVFVPKENYQDALKQYNKIKNPSYPIPIAVDKFSDAIKFLNGIGK